MNVRRTTTRRKTPAVAGPATSPGSPAQATALSGPARRLLAALDGPDRAARPDPADAAAVIVSASHGGVSLGRGRHTESAALELVRHDLAEPAAGPRGRGPVFVISSAGRSFLRRAGAGGGEAGFAGQHREVVAAVVAGESGPERVSLNAGESPLAWLRRRRDRGGEPLIGPAEFEAGERVRRDLTSAGMLPGVTARWDGTVGGGARGPSDPTDALVAARQRVRHALDAVGTDLAGLLIDLCGFLKGLETIERERGWPARSGKVVVKLALRRLADHYGLADETSGPSRSRGIAAWQAAAEAPDATRPRSGPLPAESVPPSSAARSSACS